MERIHYLIAHRPWRVLASIAAVLAIAGLIYMFPRLRDDPRTNLSYIAWKHGLADYSQQNHRLFKRDTGYQADLRGITVTELAERFPHCTVGSDYPLDSYRGHVTDDYAHADPSLTLYWLDNDMNDFGMCAFVRNGHVDYFVYVKG